MRKRKRNLVLVDGAGDKIDASVIPQPRPPPPKPERRYSSVAEAFEGPDLEMESHLLVNGDSGAVEQDGHDDEMFLVEESPVQSRPIQKNLLSRELEIALGRHFREGA
jgi:hypothetical protein